MQVPPFYSIREAHYHNNDQCGPGSEIPQKNKRYDDEGVSVRVLCEDCDKLNREPYFKFSGNSGLFQDLYRKK
jgi:hypothetical protein